MVTALLPGGAARADLNYRAEITGVEDSDLASLLDKVSELKTLEDKPPVSEEALRRRADRDLGRLADAAHSLGYWDADFSYDVDTSGETAKVTVTVKQGPLYHVASIAVLDPDPTVSALGAEQAYRDGELCGVRPDGLHYFVKNAP